jgi:hypothetical protein
VAGQILGLEEMPYVWTGNIRRPTVDKLRDQINRILFHILSNEKRADKIAELIAPELADAEKWRVLEKKYPNFCKRFDVTIDALEGEGARHE